jgi:hypothetical protein
MNIHLLDVEEDCDNKAVVEIGEDRVSTTVKYPKSGREAATISVYVSDGTLWVSTYRNHDKRVEVHRVAQLY